MMGLLDCFRLNLLADISDLLRSRECKDTREDEHLQKAYIKTKLAVAVSADQTEGSCVSKDKE